MPAAEVRKCWRVEGLIVAALRGSAGGTWPFRAGRRRSGLCVTVDYAHTPTLRVVPLSPPGSSAPVGSWSCLQDPDAARARPADGAVARSDADVVVLTTDSPRLGRTRFASLPEAVLADVR